MPLASKPLFENELAHAVNEFILRRMSRGGLKLAFAWSNRERGGKPGDQNAWDTIIKIIPAISKRLEKVYIFNQSALEIMDAFNNSDTLLYLDPPYLPSTRESTEVYDHEMSQDDHIELAECARNFKGKVLLSGYPSTLYNKLYKDWNMAKKHIANHASQQKKKEMKLEVLWKNY